MLTLIMLLCAHTTHAMVTPRIARLAQLSLSQNRVRHFPARTKLHSSLVPGSSKISARSLSFVSLCSAVCARAEWALRLGEQGQKEMLHTQIELQFWQSLFTRLTDHDSLVAIEWFSKSWLRHEETSSTKKHIVFCRPDYAALKHLAENAHHFDEQYLSCWPMTRNLILYFDKAKLHDEAAKRTGVDTISREKLEQFADILEESLMEHSYFYPNPLDETHFSAVATLCGWQIHINQK